MARFCDFISTRPAAFMLPTDKVVMLSSGKTTTATLSAFQTAVNASPTFTGTVSAAAITATGAVRINSTWPIYTMYETDGTVDQRRTDFMLNSGTTTIRVGTDAGVPIATGIQINNSTGAINLSGPSVTVPAPTTANHATTKTYVDTADALKLNLTGGTLTGALSLNLNSTALTIGSQTVASAAKRINYVDAGILRWALNVGSTNTYSLDRYNSSGVYVDSPFQVSETTGNITIPTAINLTAAPTAANHAARTTAIDATTGRMAINGYEIGKTGRRDISLLLVNSWTASGVISLQRSGSIVTLSIALIGSAATGELALTLPSGFRPMIDSYDVWVNTAEPGVTCRAFMGGPSSGQVAGQLPLMASGGTWLGAFTFITDDAWPTSLPGIAA